MQTIFKFLLLANKNLLILEKVALCLLLFSMVALSFGQVVARNLFSVGFIWITEVIRIEVLWITLIGAALATEYRQHIKIDFLFNIVESGSMKKAIETLSLAFATFVCFLLFFVAKDYISLVSSDTTSTMIQDVPDWVFKLIIPYCFLMMAIRSMISVIRIVQGIDTRDSEYSESFDELVEEKQGENV
jgi:TRAP-type C4-dicarboxylate transport system permease small subunit